MKNEILDTKSRSEWEHLINEWVHDETDRAMLKRRLLDGLLLRQIEDEFPLYSLDTIKRRLKKSQNQLFKHC